MNRPQGVRQAVLIIWATLAISAVAALLNTLLGHVGFTEFGFQIIFYALLCILPYKIGLGSNAARYIYTVLAIVSVLFLFASGDIEMPLLDYILSIILIPVEIYIIFKLFQREASSWFTAKSS